MTMDLLVNDLTLTSGAGSPEGAVIGPVGSLYMQSDASGLLWRKAAGTAATGWVSMGLSGSGTATHLARWTDTYVLGDSAVVETVAGDLEIPQNIGTSAYVSQTTGWRVTADGFADFRFMFTDEMHAKAFTADLEQALAGGQIIAKSVAPVSVEFVAPALGSSADLWVEPFANGPNVRVFEDGDYVVVRTFTRTNGTLSIADCVGTVTWPAMPPPGNPGMQAWTFTRLTGASGGTMAGATAVPVGTLALDYGISGNGYYEVNAIDGAYGANSPYAQVATWTTAPIAANRTLRARFGNLYGITGVAGEYGLIAGTYAAANGHYVRASSSAVELHGVDLLLWNNASGSWVNTVKVDHAIPSLALGDALPTSFTHNVPGIWMGRDTTDSLYKFRVGYPYGSGVGLTWNGSTLSVVGAIIVTGDGSSYVGTSSGYLSSGLFMTANYMGYYDQPSATWRARFASDGTFYAGNPATARYLSWDGTSLALVGAQVVISGTGYVGPSPVNTPGLYLTASNLGYFNGMSYTAFIDNAGRAGFGGSGHSIYWNGSALYIYAGGGNVVIDGNGIAISAGSSWNNRVRWSGGAAWIGYDGVTGHLEVGGVALYCGIGVRIGGTLYMYEPGQLSGDSNFAVMVRQGADGYVRRLGGAPTVSFATGDARTANFWNGVLMSVT